ncbi:GDSL-like Lipase/Acylhydrolase family protein [Thiohalospira halophila DSM 15071]|uniref:GDSL-like Lipase/Acylhydrolase family protein n=1 Tax=Thiohalospira halophila DSM 15071 TaxID=1123397 RepID=A0A1I1WSW8_9GAMM|nr:SGNH/GDSL hydrolase family protein [Thiohalospira halophila]SFD96180.1 GDSL-like Lipase/Acylhydrolase family protein [Thiohalospira halophila DSM 15071]
MTHYVLLGDSIFDNAAYTAGAPDTVTRLREQLPCGDRATLLAKDGAVAADLPEQIRGLPSDTDYCFLSIGGNDALQALPVLGEGARDVDDALERLARVRKPFLQQYAGGLDALLALGLPVTVCTIYEGLLGFAGTPEVDEVIMNFIFGQASPQALRTALSLYNDPITRAALARGLPLVELRAICRDPADFANPIEPSSQGSRKIAAALLAQA